MGRGRLLAVAALVAAISPFPMGSAPNAVAAPPVCTTAQAPAQPGGTAPAGWTAAHEADLPRRGLAGLVTSDQTWDPARRALFQQIAEPYIQWGGYAPRDDSPGRSGADPTALVMHAVQGAPGSIVPPDTTLFGALYNFQVGAPRIPGRTLPEKLATLANDRRRAGTEVATERAQVDALIQTLSFLARHYPTLRAMAGNDGYLSAGDIDASFASLRGQAHGIALSGTNPSTGERLPFGGAFLRARYRRRGENPVVEGKIAEAAAGPHAEFRSALVKLGAGQPADPGPHAPNYYAVQAMGDELKSLMPLLSNTFGGGGGGGGGGGMLDMSQFIDPQRGLRLAPFETIYAAVMAGTLPTGLELPRPPALKPMVASAEGVPGQHVYIAPANGLYGYLVSLPKDYSADGKYHLVMNLQGTDLRGKDPQLWRRRGLAAVTDRYRESGVEMGTVIVTPILPDFQVWDPAKVNALRDAVVRQYGHAPELTHITGHSLGGIGTLAAVRADPKGYATAVVISGAIPFQDGKESSFEPASLDAWAGGFKESKTPILMVRGKQDSVIPGQMMSVSEQALLRARPTNTFLHLEPNAGHSPPQLDGDSLLELGWFGPEAKAAQQRYRRLVEARGLVAPRPLAR